MMATTHALMGLALSALVTLVAPEYAPIAAASGLAGGAFPDLDLYAGHRRTLHLPVYYTLAAVAAGAVAVLAAGPWTVAAAVFLMAAALHAATDAFGGGLELQPWRATSDRAVYSHYHGHWIRPRRWVRYDGAPEDLLLAAAVGVPASLVYGPQIQRVVAGALALSVGYALVRKRLPALAAWLLGSLPDDVRHRIPERFVP
jgi:hypothetical protein